MKLYDLFGYTEQQIIDVEYLLDLASEMNIIERVEDSFFQFSPTLTGETNTSHEPWAVFHKKAILDELVFKCLEECIETDYELEDAIQEQIWEDKFTEFFLKNDFRGKIKETVITKFYSTYFYEEE